MNNQLPPAGWHPDPDGGPRFRYWDGHNWTVHYSPMPGSNPAPNPATPSGPSATAAYRRESADTANKVDRGGFGPMIDWAKAHKIWASVIGVAAFVLIVGLGGVAMSPPNTGDASQGASATDPEPAQEPTMEAEPEVAPSAPAIDMPEQESKFIAIVDGATGSLPSNGASELRVVQVKQKRGSDMCALLGPSLAVDGWVGTVESVSTELGGDKGILAVTISPSTAVQTNNNSLSDYEAGTMVDPNSAMFDTIANFTRGDTVVFSGRFVAGEKCIDEQSLTDIFGLMTPDFTFRFSSVEKRN